MANRITTEFKIDARDATRRLSEIERGALEAGEALDDVGTKGKVMADVLGQAADAVQADLADAKRMADLLGNALGPELTAKLNADGKLLNIVDDLRKVGLTAEDVEVDVDQLAASIRRLDDSAESVRSFNAEMGRVRTAQDRVTEGANQNRSVIANFAGNAASEIPGVAGAFGPLNMALSQAVEYGTEGNIAFKQMLTAGLAMGGVSAVISGVTAVLQSMAATKAFDRKQVDGFKESLEGVKDPLEAVLEDMREAAKIEFRQDRWNGAFGGLLQETEDVTDEMEALGLTAEDFARGVVGTADEMATFIERVKGRFAETADGATIDTRRSMEAQKRIIEAVQQARENYATATTRAEIEEAVFAATTEEAAAAVRSLDDRVEGVTRAQQDHADALARTRDEQRDALDATSELTDGYNEQRGAIDDLISQKAALVGGDIAVRQAQRDAKTAADELAASIDSGTLSFGEFGAALDDTVASQVSAAQTAASYAADQLRANGNVVDAKAETYLYKQALEDLAAQTSGPLRAALDSLIAQLDGLDGKTVNIKILANGQRVNVGQGLAIGGGVVSDGPRTEGRAAGGPTVAGRTYEVTEGGRSELLHEGGRTYLLAGRNGYVDPLVPPTNDSGPELIAP